MKEFALLCSFGGLGIAVVFFIKALANKQSELAQAWFAAATGWFTSLMLILFRMQ